MVSRIFNLGLRGFQFFCTVIIMALVGSMISSTRGADPAIINFDMFVAVFAMLSLIYLTAATFSENFEFHPVIMLALDVLNTLWFFIGAVATAAILGLHSCSSSNAGYLKSNKITRGSANMSNRCREAQAATAFLFFGLVAFIASSVFTGLNSRGRVNMRGSRSSPSMSQVG